MPRAMLGLLGWAAQACCLGGCFLIGYDSLSSSGSIDSDAGSWDFDAQIPGLEADPDGGVNAGDDGGPDHAGLRDASSDAVAPDAGEAGVDDAGTHDDAGPACARPNACGGCSLLVMQPDSACGRCGVGRFACVGADTLICMGDEALPAATGGPLLIDDLEDGDRFINTEAGLSGGWYTVSDGSGGTLYPPFGAPLVPVFGGAGGSARSVRVSGGGFAGWGAGVAVSLNAYQCGYDASLARGISFALKGSGTVTVSVATRQTTAVSAGGVCSGPVCNDHFNASFTLTGAWASQTLSWPALRQTGWGAPTVFSPGDILYVQFAFGPNTSFDLYVDDLGFY